MREKIPSEDVLEIERKGCAFCSLEVIQKQKIYEYKGILVLYNYLITPNGKKFLIVPKHHVRKTCQLSDEEALSMHQVTRSLMIALEELYGKKDSINLIQEGTSVGQTVPHLHNKLECFSSTIDWIRTAINYPNIDRVSPEEYEKIREQFVPILDRLLISEK